MAQTNRIDEQLTIIDTMDLQIEGRTSCYVLQNEKVVLFT